MKRLAVVLVIIGVVAIALWGAWRLESKSGANVSNQVPGAEFSYKLPQQTASDVGDVLITCTEDVMDAPSGEFAKWLGLQGIPLELPGGPLSIARLSDSVTPDKALMELLNPFQRVAVEVLKRHTPRKVVLVTHDMCIYYDALAAWQNNLSQVQARQRSDMSAALNTLRLWFPQAEISGFVASIDGQKLTFHKLQ